MTAPSSVVPARIHRLPIDVVQAGSDLELDQSDPGRNVLERLRLPQAPRGRGPFTILIRHETLNSPDQVALLSARVHAQRVEVEIELRSYAGPLFANVRSAIVLELGPLTIGSGPAEVVLTVHRLSFVTIDHPEVTASRATSTRVLSFTAP